MSRRALTLPPTSTGYTAAQQAGTWPRVTTTGSRRARPCPTQAAGWACMQGRSTHRWPSSIRPEKETENHPVPWASSSSSSSSNMKTWTVCMDPVSLPRHHNWDLYHLNYQIHSIELISTTPTVSLNTNGLFPRVFAAYSQTQACSHALWIQ